MPTGLRLVSARRGGHSAVDALKEEWVRRRALLGSTWVVLVVLFAGCSGESATRAVVVETVSPADAAVLLAGGSEDLVVLDVRTADEFDVGHLAGAVNLDYNASTFAAGLAALDRDVPYLIYCRSGNRSAGAREMMRDLGFAEVYEIAGGITAWVEEGLAVAGP